MLEELFDMKLMPLKTKFEDLTEQMRNFVRSLTKKTKIMSQMDLQWKNFFAEEGGGEERGKRDGGRGEQLFLCQLIKRWHHIQNEG